MRDWEVAVAGDSFVELGYLPYDQLFTTRAGAKSRQRVKNLGVSGSGPFQALWYLRSYGRAPSTRDLVLVFFEGNDIRELLGEYNSLRRFQETGERPVLTVAPEHSLLRHIGRAWLRYRKEPVRPLAEAVFTVGNQVIPVSLWYTPPEPSGLPDGFGPALDALLDQFASLGTGSSCRVWFLFMPCKHRVLYSRLQLSESAPPEFRKWKPTRLADYFRQACARHGVGFIDPTASLERETRRGLLTYNGAFDSHLNAYGCEVVANVLAEAMNGPHDGEWTSQCQQKDDK
jgi:hypothetical protein